MEILTAYQTANRCYQRRRGANQMGILVHSTGAVNRELRRYVDAPERLGKNQYGNHWNRAAADKCMHAFIGYDKDGEVIVAQTLPYQFACWGCGSGKKGSYNYDPTAHIQFEICQGSDTDETYYRKAISVAAEYCAYLCRLHGFSAENIVSHREAARAGYASNHGDPESWMRHFGDDMDKFRARVAGMLAGDVTAGEAVGVEDEPHKGDGIMPTVRRGSKGSAVMQLQEGLIYLGYTMAGNADGDFGQATEEAVRAFQQDFELAVDGVCGPATWAKLEAVMDDAGDNAPVMDDAEGVYEDTSGVGNAGGDHVTLALKLTREEAERLQKALDAALAVG